ncbi:MAG: hypothetical protein A2293_09435 [Elusimicrobia bacterium RIFOXYB2_FULL_49_7]|nr:MAG: hypothetical protein A2293_09435 [Elusimicrobia bacterium RIFOXYB2_FULL_49_7]
MGEQILNPDNLIQQTIQAKLNLYRAKETHDSFLKQYNDQVDGLIEVIQLMKARIVELEGNGQGVSLQKR